MSAERHAPGHGSPAGARQLFIYYRVSAAQADAAVAAAARMQAALRDRHTGLRALVLRRCGTADPEVTLMETYALDASASPRGVGAPLQAEIEHEAANALAGITLGARHVEVFDACA